MITAKDIQKKKFEKVKFGYSPEEVDAFLSQIENDLRLMQQDLDDSNDKIQLLVSSPFSLSLHTFFLIWSLLCAMTAFEALTMFWVER